MEVFSTHRTTREYELSVTTSNTALGKTYGTSYIGSKRIDSYGCFVSDENSRSGT